MTKLYYDPVEKPAHYNISGIECIDYIEQVLGTQGAIDYCRGNAIKYQHRATLKGSYVEDMKKARWYQNKAIELIDKLTKG